MALSTKMMMRSSVGRAGVAFLLVSLGTACGSSDSASRTDGGHAGEGATDADGEGTADAMKSDATVAQDAGATDADGGGAEDTGANADTGPGQDSGSEDDTGPAGDSSRGPDAGSAEDSGSQADSGTVGDSGAILDSGSTPDSETIADSRTPTDARDASDAGMVVATAVVNLGSAAGYVILSKTGISTVPPSAITGNMGVSPAAATYITGFALIASPSNVFSTSTQVTGQIFAADYASPTPSNLTTAIGDMQLAYTDAAGRPPNVTELGAGNIGGMTLAPGVYEWGSAVLIPTSITLSGSANDVWIFQVAQDLTLSSATNVTLTGGAVPGNVFWQVAGLVNLGTTAHLEGIILGQTSIALGTGASVNGRLLTQTAVTLDGNSVVQPAP